MNYLKQRINATFQTLNLTELDKIEKHCTVNNLRQLSRSEAVKLCKLLDTLRVPNWTIVNRHVDSLEQKIMSYSRKV